MSSITPLIMMMPPRQTVHQHRPRSDSDAFSFIELLVVIALLAILTLVLFPAFAASAPDSKIFQCLAEKRQLTLGWIMYLGDNSDRLMAVADNNTGSYTLINNSSSSPDYNFMDWSSNAYVTNTSGLVGPTALMSQYVADARTYKCPSDKYQSTQNRASRTRSVSVAGSLDGGNGGAPTFNTGISGRTYFEARKITDLAKPGPANIYVFVDEQADSIDDLKFMLDPGYPPSGEHWRELPGGYHNGAGCISFADGHTEAHRWQAWGGLFTTVQSVAYNNYNFQTSQTPWGSRVLVRNADYEWLDNRLPYH